LAASWILNGRIRHAVPQPACPIQEHGKWKSGGVNSESPSNQDEQKGQERIILGTITNRDELNFVKLEDIDLIHLGFNIAIGR
jgi:hypothetical protein